MRVLPKGIWDNGAIPFKEQEVSADKPQPGEFGYYDGKRGVYSDGNGGTLTYIQWQAEKRKRLRNPAKVNLPDRTMEDAQRYQESQGKAKKP